MKAKLLCRSGELAGRDYVIERDATIGSATSNSVAIASPLISHDHARLAFDEANGRWTLEDLGTKNGTRVDGVRIDGRVTLGNLHVITFADAHEFIFHTSASGFARAVGSAVAPTEEQPLPMLKTDEPLAAADDIGVTEPSPAERADSRRLPDTAVTSVDTVHGELLFVDVPTALGRGGVPERDVAPRWQLEMHATATDAAAVYPLNEGEHVVGRASDCDIRIADRTISRRHATITVTGGRLTMRDMSSANSTFAQDQPITGETELQPGAIVRFGLRTATIVRQP